MEGHRSGVGSNVRFVRKSRLSGRPPRLRLADPRGSGGAPAAISIATRAMQAIQVHIDHLVASVADRLGGPGPRHAPTCLIAIDGRSGVGKSTIAEQLAQRLDAALVSGDDFYAGGTEIHAGSPEDLADICIDRRRLGAVLKDLKAGRAVDYRAFDWDRFDESLSVEPVTIRPRPVVIAEGVYANHPDLGHLVDLSVLVRVPEAERARRLLDREGALTAWERQWHRAEDWYFATAARPEHFDVVIDNH